ncbi:MAG: hypothetical protein ABMA64_02760 [Myxococcota bacterium]
MFVLLPSFAWLGCSGEAPAPPAPAPVACGLSFDSLAGKTFVRQIRSQDGSAWEEDTWARARFYKDGDKTKMKYNTRALVDMYDYTCAKGKGEILCLADKIDLQQWCQTLIANKGSCSAADLAELTGVPVDEASKARAELMPKIEGQTPEQLAKMKQAFSQPNNQLRGVMHLKVNTEECRLTARDTFQTMTEGKLSELENYVGSSRFVTSDKDLVFENCGDHQSLVALTAPDAAAKPGETKVQWKVNEAIPFKYVNEALTKPEDGCTYSMDEYVTYEPVQKGAAVTPGADGKLGWGFSHTFTEPGSKVVHLYRYKACGGAEMKLEDVTCAMVKVE